jgi:hypothetical protein
VEFLHGGCQGYGMNPDDPVSVSGSWLHRAEELWDRARKIAASREGVDVTGVHHALRNLERSPEERLRRALSFGRLRSDGG